MFSSIQLFFIFVIELSIYYYFFDTLGTIKNLLYFLELLGFLLIAFLLSVPLFLGSFFSSKTISTIIYFPSKTMNLVRILVLLSLAISVTTIMVSDVPFAKYNIQVNCSSIPDRNSLGKKNEMKTSENLTGNSNNNNEIIEITRINGTSSEGTRLTEEIDYSVHNSVQPLSFIFSHYDKIMMIIKMMNIHHFRDKMMMMMNKDDNNDQSQKKDEQVVENIIDEENENEQQDKVSSSSSSEQEQQQRSRNQIEIEDLEDPIQIEIISTETKTFVAFSLDLEKAEFLYEKIINFTENETENNNNNSSSSSSSSSNNITINETEKQKRKVLSACFETGFDGRFQFFHILRFIVRVLMVAVAHFFILYEFDHLFSNICEESAITLFLTEISVLLNDALSFTITATMVLMSFVLLKFFYFRSVAPLIYGISLKEVSQKLDLDLSDDRGMLGDLLLNWFDKMKFNLPNGICAIASCFALLKFKPSGALSLKSYILSWGAKLENQQQEQHNQDQNNINEDNNDDIFAGDGNNQQQQPRRRNQQQQQQRNNNQNNQQQQQQQQQQKGIRVLIDEIFEKILKNSSLLKNHFDELYKDAQDDELGRNNNTENIESESESDDDDQNEEKVLKRKQNNNNTSLIRRNICFLIELVMIVQALIPELLYSTQLSAFSTRTFGFFAIIFIVFAAFALLPILSAPSVPYQLTTWKSVFGSAAKLYSAMLLTKKNESSSSSSCEEKLLLMSEKEQQDQSILDFLSLQSFSSDDDEESTNNKLKFWKEDCEDLRAAPALSVTSWNFLLSFFSVEGKKKKSSSSSITNKLKNFFFSYIPISNFVAKCKQSFVLDSSLFAFSYELKTVNSENFGASINNSNNMNEKTSTSSSSSSQTPKKSNNNMSKMFYLELTFLSLKFYLFYLPVALLRTLFHRFEQGSSCSYELSSFFVVDSNAHHHDHQQHRATKPTYCAVNRICRLLREKIFVYRDDVDQTMARFFSSNDDNEKNSYYSSETKQFFEKVFENCGLFQQSSATISLLPVTTYCLQIPSYLNSSIAYRRIQELQANLNNENSEVVVSLMLDLIHNPNFIFMLRRSFDFFKFFLCYKKNNPSVLQHNNINVSEEEDDGNQNNQNNTNNNRTHDLKKWVQMFSDPNRSHVQFPDLVYKAQETVDKDEDLFEVVLVQILLLSSNIFSFLPRLLEVLRSDSGLNMNISSSSSSSSKTHKKSQQQQHQQKQNSMRITVETFLQNFTEILGVDGIDIVQMIIGQEYIGQKNLPQPQILSWKNNFCRKVISRQEANRISARYGLSRMLPMFTLAMDCCSKNNNNNSQKQQKQRLLQLYEKASQLLFVVCRLRRQDRILADFQILPFICHIVRETMKEVNSSYSSDDCEKFDVDYNLKNIEERKKMIAKEIEEKIEKIMSQNNNKNDDNAANASTTTNDKEKRRSEKEDSSSDEDEEEEDEQLFLLKKKRSSNWQYFLVDARYTLLQYHSFFAEMSQPLEFLVQRFFLHHVPKDGGAPQEIILQEPSTQDFLQAHQRNQQILPPPQIPPEFSQSLGDRPNFFLMLDEALYHLHYELVQNDIGVRMHLHHRAATDWNTLRDACATFYFVTCFLNRSRIAPPLHFMLPKVIPSIIGLLFNRLELGSSSVRESSDFGDPNLIPSTSANNTDNNNFKNINKNNSRNFLETLLKQQQKQEQENFGARLVSSSFQFLNTSCLVFLAAGCVQVYESLEPIPQERKHWLHALSHVSNIHNTISLLLPDSMSNELCSALLMEATAVPGVKIVDPTQIFYSSLSSSTTATTNSSSTSATASAATSTTASSSSTEQKQKTSQESLSREKISTIKKEKECCAVCLLPLIVQDFGDGETTTTSSKRKKKSSSKTKQQKLIMFEKCGHMLHVDCGANFLANSSNQKLCALCRSSLV